MQFDSLRAQPHHTFEMMQRAEHPQSNNSNEWLQPQASQPPMITPQQPTQHLHQPPQLPQYPHHLQMHSGGADSGPMIDSSGYLQNSAAISTQQQTLQGNMQISVEDLTMETSMPSTSSMDDLLGPFIPKPVPVRVR